MPQPERDEKIVQSGSDDSRDTDEQEEDRRRRGYWRATWIAALGSIGMVIVSVVSSGLTIHASQVLSTALGLGAVGYGIGRYYGVEVSFRRPSMLDMAFALGLGVGLSIFGTGASSLIEQATMLLAEEWSIMEWLPEVNEARQRALQKLLLPNHPEMIGIVLLVVAVIPGIFEEYVYRGVIPEVLTEPKISFRAGYIGVLFALMHVDPFAFIPLVIVGASLQLFSEWSSGWASAAIAHIALNATTAAVLVRVFGLESLSAGNATLACVVGGAIGAGVLFILRKNSMPHA